MKESNGGKAHFNLVVKNISGLHGLREFSTGIFRSSSPAPYRYLMYQYIEVTRKDTETGSQISQLLYGLQHHSPYRRQ